MAADPAILLTDVKFAYGPARPVFTGLDIRVEAGERVGLWGPNGSGKTTLVHLIMGLLKPDSGTVSVFGKVAENEKEFREVRRRIGLVFQDPNDQLFSPTVAEDIAFGPLNLGKTHTEAGEIVASTLETVGLSGFADRVTYQLSLGEKKLVALASVLAMEPEMLLLDEPMAGLDESAKEKITLVLREISAGYLLISHDKKVLEDLASRVVRLDPAAIAE
jgi:cobalt/nickel transport system ATP-binding protein